MRNFTTLNPTYMRQPRATHTAGAPSAPKGRRVTWETNLQGSSYTEYTTDSPARMYRDKTANDGETNCYNNLIVTRGLEETRTQNVGNKSKPRRIEQIVALFGLARWAFNKIIFICVCMCMCVYIHSHQSSNTPNPVPKSLSFTSGYDGTGRPVGL